MRYATRLCGDVETARDVVQECFLELCRQRPGDLNGYLRQWLFTVCRNRAFDQLRKKDGRMTTLEGTEPLVEPTDTLEQREQTGQVLDRVRELPARQQEVLRLKFQQGLSYREIAAVIDVSVSNVGFLLHTALKTLRGHAAEAERNRS